ncbi:type I polyketide synthase [Mucilaginibacter sp. SP1R1]|uniref:type I polyketide synthase n=1 Tax=Mucilaginibacter sp. SP1R1 TaxID=2723091 RepID=UPI001610CE86|nr:type I polyketide synthase [Mucilaginibacter sp. SP1R1]MBB6148795.1 acyl transferase domain-containing protein/acyl carrier protein [Mucilaginibacter sp. SP1R1]
MIQENTYSPIAIVGMGCRFPGGTNTPEQYWKLLMSGLDAIEDIPQDRWSQDYFYSDDRAQPGSLISQQGGFIKDVAGFDNSFFGFSNLEAANMDPQQRQLLQVSWEAMEQGQIPCDQWAGKQVGVFMGCFSVDYHLMQFTDPMEMGAFAATGIMNTMLSNRISYAFDFKGPSMSIDTACSASLTAVHQACCSLQNGESEMALAGGSMLMLIPDYHIAETKTGILSKDARCKSFSAAANGYVRSEGIGVVVLKRLEDALAAGDHILGTIIGSSVNQDGRTNGITLPNPESQMAVMRNACKWAGINPGDVSYVEAHGTGTFSGDPIEAKAIGTVFCLEVEREKTLWIGSCKSNIGHTESASGVAGLIKTVLCLQHKQIPPNLHIEKLNPAIPFDHLRLKIPLAPENLETGDQPLIAGVNSFGFGGSNAHVLVREYQIAEIPVEQRPDVCDSFLLPLSAQSEKALKTMALDYAETAKKLNSYSTADLCYNAANRRSQLSKRKVFLAKNKEGLIDQLLRFGNEPVAGWPLQSGIKRITWVFPGIGRLFYGISNGLIQNEPVFREMYAQCDRLYAALCGFSLLKVLQQSSPDDTITDPAISQPAQFFHQVSLAALWRARGIKPHTIVGYSAGELAAFYEAGAYTLDECLEFIFMRIKLLIKLQGTGAMLAVNASEAVITPLLQPYSGEVVIAAYNSAVHLTLSGNKAAITAIMQDLEQANITCSLLWEEIAYHHTKLLDDADLSTQHYVAVPQVRKPQILLYSTATAGLITPETFLPDHWVKNISEPVYFKQVIDKIMAAGACHFMELSGKPMLIPYLYTITGTQKAAILNPLSVLPGIPEDRQILAKIFEAGYHVNWSTVYPKGNRMELPLYSWQNEKLWQEPEKSKRRRLRPAEHSLLGSLTDGQDNQWETIFSVEKMPWLLDHNIMGDCLLPGATYIDMALAALHQKAGKGRSFVIEDLRFIKAVRIPKKAVFFVRFSLDEQARSFSISVTKSLWPKEFEEVAKGRFRQLPPGGIANINPQQHIEKYEPFIAGSDMYQFFNSIYYKYGPAFQGLERVYKNENEAFCEITVPQEYCTDNYRYHPAALDIAFHAMLTLKHKKGQNDAGFEIPEGIDQIRIFKQPEPKMLVHARLTETTESGSKTDLYLYNVSGDPIGVISGFRTSSLNAGSKKQLGAIQSPQSLVIPGWEEFAMETSAATNNKQFVILSDKHPIAEKLALSLQMAGHKVTSANSAFFGIDDEDIVINELSNLLSSLDPETEIINCLSLGANSFDGSILYVIKPLIYLAKTIKQTGFTGKLWSVSQQSQQVEGFLHDVNVFQAALWGINNVFGHQEFRDNYKGIIDVNGIEDVNTLTYILSAASLPENQIAIRGGSAFCKRLNPYPVTTAEAALVSFDAQATYLITGAFGAIGKEVTQWMLRTGARNLLLTTSRDLNADAVWLQTLREQGAKIEVIQVDFTNPKSIVKLRSEVVDRKVKGLIYCAGISDDQLLERIDDATLRKVLSAKIQGAYNLHEALSDVPLEHFVLFSSVGSLLPNRGLGSYAAANAALDALAQKRKFMGLPALSINWGPWSIGMFQKTDFERVFSLMGINSLSAEQGIRFLESVFYSNQVQVLIQLADWPKLLSSSLADNNLFSNYQHLLKGDASVNKAMPDINTVEGDMITELSVLLNMQGSEIELDKSIADYDMESISVMVLSDIIDKQWGVAISVDELWRINSFADLIAKITIAISGRYRENQLVN